MTLPTRPDDGGVDYDKAVYQLQDDIRVYGGISKVHSTLVEFAQEIAAHARERCAKIALAHKGSATKDREKKGHAWSEEIGAEERGEDIAAEMIAAALRKMED